MCPCTLYWRYCCLASNFYSIEVFPPTIVIVQLYLEYYLLVLGNSNFECAVSSTFVCPHDRRFASISRDVTTGALIQYLLPKGPRRIRALQYLMVVSFKVEDPIDLPQSIAPVVASTLFSGMFGIQSRILRMMVVVSVGLRGRMDRTALDRIAGGL